MDALDVLRNTTKCVIIAGGSVAELDDMSDEEMNAIFEKPTDPQHRTYDAYNKAEEYIIGKIDSPT